MDQAAAELNETASRLGLVEEPANETRPNVAKVKNMLNARLKIEITDG